MNKISIDTGKSIVVSGKSILSSTAKILSTNVSRCTYLEYRTFCDFLEAVVLHEKVYILGEFSRRDNLSKDLMQQLNLLNKSEFIFLIDDSNRKFFINRQDVDSQIKNLMNNVFQNKVSFIRKQLLQKSFTSRHNDDERMFFLDDITTSLEEFTTSNKKEKESEIIKGVIINHCNKQSNSEFLKHLFRGFVIASVATILNGTAKLTGSRKPLSLVIKTNNPKCCFDTDLFKIYQYVNSLYLSKQTKDDSHFFQPLLLSIFLKEIQYHNKEESLSLIIKLRKKFKRIRNVYSNIKSDSQREINRKNKKFKNAYKYYNEIYRFASNNNIKNLWSKYSKELFLDEVDTDVKHEFEYNSNEQIENTLTISSKINIITVVKNAAKFLIQFCKNTIINIQNKPLTTYFVKLLNSQMPVIDDFIVIDEFHKNKMKTFDNLIAKHKL